MCCDSCPPAPPCGHSRTHLAAAPQTAALATSAAAAGALAYYATADVQRKFELVSATGPLVRLLDPETSHKLGIWTARLGLFPRETRPDPEPLRVQLWGRTFPNPLGEGQQPPQSALLRRGGGATLSSAARILCGAGRLHGKWCCVKGSARPSGVSPLSSSQLTGLRALPVRSSCGV
jgi:hypothetical protein